MRRKRRTGKTPNPKRTGPQGEREFMAMFSLALRHYQVGDFQESERICQEISRRFPGQPDNLNCRGLIACQTGKTVEGVRLFRKAIRINPEVPDYHQNLGNAHHELGSLKQATLEYQEALRLRPDFDRAHF